MVLCLFLFSCWSSLSPLHASVRCWMNLWIKASARCWNSLRIKFGNLQIKFGNPRIKSGRSAIAAGRLKKSAGLKNGWMKRLRKISSSATRSLRIVRMWFMQFDGFMPGSTIFLQLLRQGRADGSATGPAIGNIFQPTRNGTWTNVSVLRFATSFR